MPDRAGRTRLSAWARGANPRAAPVPSGRMSSRVPASAVEGAPVDARADSRAWLDALRAAVEPSTTEPWLACTSCSCGRPLRSPPASGASHVRGEELDDLAHQAAGDALVAVLAKLDDFRGASRFTTWAYKFALLEAGVRLRKRAWQEREVVLGRGVAARGGCAAGPAGPGRDGRADAGGHARHRRLSHRAPAGGARRDRAQRRADRRSCRSAEHTRGALYKTLHDARPKATLRPRHARLHARLDLAETDDGQANRRHHPGAPPRPRRS